MRGVLLGLQSSVISERLSEATVERVDASKASDIPWGTHVRVNQSLFCRRLTPLTLRPDRARSLVYPYGTIQHTVRIWQGGYSVTGYWSRVRLLVTGAECGYLLLEPRYLGPTRIST